MTTPPTTVATTVATTTVPSTAAPSPRPAGSLQRSGALLGAVLGVGITVLCLVAAVCVWRRPFKSKTKVDVAQGRSALLNIARSGAEAKFHVEYGAIFGEQDWQAIQIAPEEIRQSDRPLGRGHFSEVWFGHLLPNSRAGSGRAAQGTAGATEVAIKMLGPSGLELFASGQSDLRQRDPRTLLLLEGRLHSCLHHPNIVQLYGVQETTLPVMLVLEYCDSGNLLNALRQARAPASGGQDFSLAQRRDMAAQVASGLAYLHSKLCLHRDLAARNVLLKTPAAGAGPMPVCGYNIKLSDLGLSRAASEDYYRVRRGGVGSGCARGCVALFVRASGVRASSPVFASLRLFFLDP